MKVAIIILTDTETHESLGRVVNALSFAKELKENDDEVLLVFDGAGPRWIPELEDETHKAHPQYQAVKDKIDGACKFCSKAFGVFDEVAKSGVKLLDDYHDHPSLRGYISQGYQIVTF